MLSQQELCRQQVFLSPILGINKHWTRHHRVRHLINIEAVPIIPFKTMMTMTIATLCRRNRTTCQAAALQAEFPNKINGLKLLCY